MIGTDHAQNLVHNRGVHAAAPASRRFARFGLVFEEHVPEVTSLVDQPVQTGTTVQRRDDPTSDRV